MSKKGLLYTIIRRKVLVSMLFIGFSVMGYISYNKLPVELLPNVELPLLIVRVNATSEVDPKYMESKAIVPLESAISTLEGVEEITANANSRQGMIFISFQQGVNIKYAYLKLEQKVGAIQSDLSPEFMVNITKIDTEQFSNAFMELQVLGSGGVDRVRNVTDQYISDRLEDVDGVGGVEIFGGRQKTVEIIMNDAICEASGITPNTISTVLSQNSDKSAFAGQVEHDGRQVFVNVSAELKDIKDIQSLVVSDKGPLLLSDVAEVFFGVKEQTSLSRVNGKDAVSIRLSKDTQANLIALSDKTLEAIDALNKELEPMDVEVVIQSNQAELMNNNIDQIQNLAITGGLLAIFVLWVFLRRLKFILSIALAIPISVYTAFNFFYAYDISINSLTLIGMALAMGMLLDNSVVVIENIYRHVINRKTAEDAVVDGTKEVRRSVIAATLTTVTVFLPFIFSSNFLVTTIGTHIGVSIISTLLVSLVVALVLIPMLAHTTIGKEDQEKAPLIKNATIRQRIIQIYLVILKSCFRRPAFTIVGGLVLFFVTIGISLLVSVADSNEVETPEMNLFVTMPQGATLASTDLKTKKIEERVMEIPVTDKVISQISEGSAVIHIELIEGFNDLDTITVPDIRNQLNSIGEEFEDLDISLDEPPQRGRGQGSGGFSPSDAFERMLGMGSAKERIIIKGQDFELMKAIANDINNFVSGLQSIRRSSVNISPDRPEAHILFDQRRMSENNITQQNVKTGLNDFQSSFASGSKFVSGGEEFEITIRTQNQVVERAKEMKDLREMPISSSTGATHSLSDIGSVIFSSGESTITRLNQEKRIEITYRFIEEVLNSESLLEASRIEIDQIVSGVNIPSGIVVDVIHDEGLFDEFYFLLFAAVVIIFMILAAVFESLYLPVVIMFSIPLAAIGAFLGLTFTGNSLLNANTLIGFLILLGVVVNNGIILIDYSRILRKKGYNKYRALIMSGISRIRPILITSITTIVAMLPLALGEAEYVVNIGQPFAVTVMGGLAFATILTLIYIPTMSAGLESALGWFRNLKPAIKGIQILLLVVLGALIFLKIEGMLWQMIWFLLVVLLIPGGTYFIMTSLRQANTKMVSPDEKMHIEIQNLTKVYGRDKRWIREWKGNKHLFDERGEKITSVRSVLQNLIWQSALIVFLVYFIYFFLDKAFWQLFFMITLHALFFSMVNEVSQIVSDKKRKRIHFTYALLYWVFPIVSSLFLYGDINVKGLGVLLITLWFIGLFLVSASRRLSENPVNPKQITGRFKKLRRLYYMFLLAIPFVKPKKEKFKALKGVNLNIEQGMFGLLGPNGAGKTTLMRILCGILDQSYGKIWINGHDTTLRREELQGLIGYLPQSFGTYENMTPYQFLDYQAILRKITNKEKREKRVQYVLKAVHMEEHQHKKIGSFSGGMKQRIGIAQILLHLPKILVVDEPTAGLDPLERIRFRNLLVELSQERIVIFSTHIIEDIASSCNHLAVLISGNIEYVGNPTAMAQLAHGKVWEFHLSPEAFEAEKDKYVIVHHMREGDQIQVKCLSEIQPRAEAVQVRANLEDAYLWLMKSKNRNVISKNGKENEELSPAAI
ncbi:efflux RND transporter permease subunit [Xanthovirga aplysinae]|uniref:efflux RND transporter permease subunit n=1 Tax=Xanthovirga aplysinae TaxID=2529853 RepID=UPI0012BD526F|nr:efflux RND transporter permease subunit [Xanthovirga aplysinae]MTI33194.1 ATP-binding cassette domain-containing protein [Xanthovirga aplysinae]